jgi:hypothetical protein
MTVMPPTCTSILHVINREPYPPISIIEMAIWTNNCVVKHKVVALYMHFLIENHSLIRSYLSARLSENNSAHKTEPISIKLGMVGLSVKFGKTF